MLEGPLGCDGGCDGGADGESGGGDEEEGEGGCEVGWPGGEVKVMRKKNSVHIPPSHGHRK